MIKKGDIIIKNTKVARGIFERNYAPLLLNIFVYIANNHGIYITESYRPKRHMNDLHGTLPSRALDIRSRVYKDPIKLEREINSIWQYDPGRPSKQVALYHDVGNGEHIHLQVCPKTRRRSSL